MKQKQYLLTPGPAPVPEEVSKVMAEPIIHHRTPQYKENAQKVNENLKKIFKTKNNVLTFTSSGTGAMEASITNTLSKNDTAIVVRGGKFGERFANICSAYGVKAVPIDVEWGARPEASAVDEALNKNKDAKAVFIQLCETSTATVYGVKAIGEVVKKRGAILVVDAVSGLGADEFETDKWNVDIAVGGSQKGLMIPPGLSFCAVSQKAWDLVKKSTLPRFYYDFNKYNKLVAEGDNPWTPAISLVLGLGKALSMITEEGVDKFIKRHHEDAEFVRESIENLGLKLFSKFPSDAVTAVNAPEGVDAGNIIKALKARGITFAGGQDTLKGKIFRIAHMGAINRQDLEFALGALKEVLKEQNIKV